MSEKRIVFIFGPTGVGKSALAVKVAGGIGEIVSVDSMQVYRGLDCGTAKPTADQRAIVPHHLVSIVPPSYRFSAGDFMRLAERTIEEITRRGLLPILVGGTGLYFQALEYSLDEAPKADTTLRDRFYREEEESRGILYRRLERLDPDYARKLHENDLLRIVRALEICELTGRRFSDVTNKSRNARYEVLKIGIDIQRDELYRNIESRCGRMIQEGLSQEVYGLVCGGIDERLPAMRGLGYSHFVQYFKGCLSYEETVRLFVRDTRRYAKRQLCWFRRENAEWFTPDNWEEVQRRIERFVAG
ncbi:MAG: tRNA (adenosine(37)-N6)-dimethylallyltransferase MiaA [Spirochaetes bacterium]|nr:tRNA (adenosine(37)-N6)-dimethylallyltransferase MiaA [Spirochaetota bacterium]